MKNSKRAEAKLSSVIVTTHKTAADIIASAKAARDRIWSTGKKEAPARVPRNIIVEFTEPKNFARREYDGLNPKFVKAVEKKVAERNPEKVRLAMSRARIKYAISRKEKRRLHREINNIPSLTEQIKALCVKNNIDYEWIIRSDIKNRDLVNLRYEFMREIATKNLDMSLTEIARSFNCASHTAVRCALGKLGCPERGYPARE